MSKTDCSIEYKLIPGFPFYQAGSDGSVWCCRGPRGAFFGWRQMKPKIASPGKRNRMPYRIVELYSLKIRRQFTVHELILTTFREARPEGKEARHLDGNPANNSLSNLVWGTSKENGADKVRHKTTARGQKNGVAKLAEGDVLEIRERYAQGDTTYAKLAAAFGVSDVNIGLIVRREKWKHI